MFLLIHCILCCIATASSRQFGDSCQTSNDRNWHAHRELVRRTFGLNDWVHSWKQHGAAWLQTYEQENLHKAPPNECPEGVLFYQVYALALAKNITLDQFPQCVLSTSKRGRLACAVNLLLTNREFRNMDILALTKSGWPLFGLIHQVVAHTPHRKNSALFHYQWGGGPRDMLQQSSPIELALSNMSADELLDLFDPSALEGDATFIPPRLHRSLQMMTTLGQSAEALTTPQSGLPLLLHTVQLKYLYTSRCPPATHLVAAKGAVPFRLCVRDTMFGLDAAMSSYGNWDTCEYLLKLYRKFIGMLPSESPAQAKACLIVDIGCHIGVCVLHFAMRGCRVIAVDIRKDHIQMLNTSAWLNGLESNVTPVLAAVSNTTGGDVIVSDGANTSPQHTRICQTGDSQLASCSNGTSVPIWRMDDLLESLGIHVSDVSMMKVNTEGHDINVLHGAEEILACRPQQAGPVVAFGMYPDFYDELLAFLFTHGFDVMHGNSALNHAVRSTSEQCSQHPPVASRPTSTTSTSTKPTTSVSPSTLSSTGPNFRPAIDCEWMQLLLNPNTSLLKVGERVVYDHLLRMSVWASQTAPELMGMREAYPLVTEDALKNAAMDVVCRRCKPFMPLEPVGDLRNRLVRGMAECVHEHEKSVLSNLTARKAVDGMPGLRMPCRESVISGDLLLQKNGLKQIVHELGPHQKSVECAAEIALVPALHLPPIFSAVRDLRKACSVFLNPGMLQWQPWCRGIQHLFREDDGYTSSHEAWWTQQLVIAGLLESGAADGGVVQPSSLSLDQEDGSYLGLFRIDNASTQFDSVVRCDCDWPWPECHSQCTTNSWYGSAWHDPTINARWMKDFYPNGIPQDATFICCRMALGAGWFTVSLGCDKSALSQTCPLLTEAERKGKFVNMYESCLQRQLQPIRNMSSPSAWLSMVSKSLCRCCRDKQAQAHSHRVLQKPNWSKLCQNGVHCREYSRIDRLFHTWHPWDHHYFHILFENLPTILAFREYLADNADINIRIGNRKPSEKLLGKASEVLHEFGLPLTRMIAGKGFRAKELWVARIIPATSLLMPPAQLLIPTRAMLCTASLVDTTAGEHGAYGSTVWELAIRNPRECEKPNECEAFGYKGFGKCYTTGVVTSPQDQGVLKILLAEHGRSEDSRVDSRCWTPAKHVVHEAVRQVESLLPAELLPRAVVVADVVIGNFPSDFQRRSFSEAHIVVGGMGSQLANAALCMQPGAYLGVIQPIGDSDPYLWNQASSFGVQYWSLISSDPVERWDRLSPYGFSADDEISLKVFMERALVGTAAMLVHEATTRKDESRNGHEKITS